MSASSHFGINRPKDSATKVRQAGNSSATSGVNNIDNNAGSFPGMGKGRQQQAVPTGSIDPRYTVKQVGTKTGTGSASNSQNYRDPSFKTFNVKKRSK